MKTKLWKSDDFYGRSTDLMQDNFNKFDYFYIPDSSTKTQQNTNYLYIVFIRLVANQSLTAA